MRTYHERMLRAVIGDRTVSRSIVYEALREPSIVIDCALAYRLGAINRNVTENTRPAFFPKLVFQLRSASRGKIKLR